MVEYDSIIPPGQVGKITEAITVKGMHGGTFRKSVSVISNDSKNPTLRLSLGGNILPIVGMSRSYIRLKSGGQHSEDQAVVLTTQKKDFSVKEISFVTRGGGEGPSWQAAMPYYINNTVAKADTVDPDGYYSFTVNMSLKARPDGSQSGEFVLKTNHPKSPEVKIRGMIEPGE